MNKQLKISVNAFSTYGEYISVPEFDSIIGDGEKQNRHFVSGIGTVISSGEDADMFPVGSVVVFCGYTSKTIQQIVITNCNNVAIVHGEVSQSYVLAGYAAFILNALTKANVALGESVCVNIKNIVVKDFVKWLLRKTSRVVSEQEDNADAFLSDAPINGLVVTRGNQSAQVSFPADLSDNPQFSCEAKQFPPYYITASMPKLLKSSLLLLRDPDIDSFLERIGCSVVNPIVEKIELPVIEYTPQWSLAERLHDLFERKTDAALVSISLMVDDVEKYAEYISKVIQYVVGYPIALDNVIVGNIRRFTAKAKDGSVINCRIVKSSANYYDASFHADGESYTMNAARTVHYFENSFITESGIELIKL